MVKIIETLTAEDVEKQYAKSQKATEYEEALDGLSVGQLRTIEIDEKETQRSARFNLNKAAKEREWKLQYVATENERLVRFIVRAAAEPKRTRKKRESNKTTT